ncbi:hypothetical protein D3C80_2015510 [compost metagenome]
MLRPLAFIAVRQKDGQVAALCPFSPSGGDELVNDDLGGIGEIAVLGFPDYKGIGRKNIIAVLISKHRGF